MSSLNTRLVTVRQELPVTERLAYLNSGTAGPLSRRVAQAIAAQNEHELLEGRANLKVYLDVYLPLLVDLRARFARLLGAGEDEIALTNHTTDGMNIAVWGLPWQPGDEIVTTTLEHPGGLLPVYAAARRFGLRLRMVDLGKGEGDVAGKVAAALSSRTRLVVISHLSYKTGAVMPLAEIAQAAHRVGALIAVDGAQSAGTLPVNVRELDVDFYAVPGQKWLCGPEGVGALVVRRERVSELAPTFVGYRTLRDPIALDLSGFFIPGPGASRYEVGSLHWPAMFGMRESLRWLEEEVGYAWIYERVGVMTLRCREVLTDLPGVTLLSPDNHVALTTFSLVGLEPQATSEALANLGVIIRWLVNPHALRASTGFFNTDDDLARLRDGLLSMTKSQ